MKKTILVLTGLICLSSLMGQERSDSLSQELKRKIIDNARYFDFGFYIDAYYSMTLGNKGDTGNITPFFANCPFHDEIRLNVAAMEIAYDNSKVRGKLAIQYGDAPNLLAAPGTQFIKNLRQANFGFKITKDLWIDFGYMFNPVGYESSWPVFNALTTATLSGYFEPGMLLGVKASYRFSDKLNGGLMFGNSYSLAYDKNTHFAGIIFLNYFPHPKVGIIYNAFFGNQALKNARLDNDILYNNLILTYNPIKPLSLVAQIDIAAQTNSTLPPDTNDVAVMYSGFLQAKYSFLKKFAFSIRYEMFNDPNGFLSGTYIVEGERRGLKNDGFTAGVEFKPVSIGYIRLEYRYLHAYGNNVYYSKTSDWTSLITLNTGVYF